MSRDHLTSTVLFRAATDAPIAADDRRHLDACHECLDSVRLVQRAAGVFQERTFWSQQEAARIAAARVMRSLIQFSNRITKEESQAATTLAQSYNGDLAILRITIANDRDLSSVGMVNALIKLSESERERNPTQALAVIRLAAELAYDIPAGQYPRHTISNARGLVERELSSVLSLLARYSEALAALRRAADLLSHSVATTFDLAVLHLIRSWILAATERTDEALSTIQEINSTFLDFGDIERHANAKILEAMLVDSQGDTTQASLILESALDLVLSRGDEKSLAAIYANLGNLSLRKSNPAQAIPYFVRAREINTRLGRIVEVARSYWQLGAASVRLGQIDDGIRSLKMARKQFIALSIPADVAVVSLELVEALLLANDRSSAQSICNDLPHDCAALGMPRNALTALAYLQECAAGNELTAVVAREVRSFIQNLALNPTREFTPLELT